VLVPEISLTPQMVDRFLARFGECIAVLHSKLSVGERYDEWKKIKEGRAKIVIGARSGIFAPISNLGIIIIDEEHDQSYKSDMTPRYNAKDLAKYIAKQKNIPIVLRKCNTKHNRICQNCRGRDCSARRRSRTNTDYLKEQMNLACQMQK